MALALALATGVLDTTVVDTSVSPGDTVPGATVPATTPAADGTVIAVPPSTVPSSGSFGADGGWGMSLPLGTTAIVKAIALRSMRMLSKSVT